MPIICTFYGLIIRMYFNDHAPPHFHVQYGDQSATIDIRACALLEGRLSPRALEMALDWTRLHRRELLIDWQLCMEKKQPLQIEPLD